MLDATEQKKGGFRAFSERQQERSVLRDADGHPSTADAAGAPTAGVTVRADKTMQTPVPTTQPPTPR
jgi:hypothetical protein